MTNYEEKMEQSSDNYLVYIPGEEVSLIDPNPPKLYLVTARDIDGERHVRLVVAKDEDEVKEKDNMDHYDIIYYNAREINVVDGYRVCLMVDRDE